MTKKEKLDFRIKLYNNFTNKIQDCLDDLDNKKQLKELLYMLQGYFDASLLEQVRTASIKQIVHIGETSNPIETKSTKNIVLEGSDNE